MSHLNIKTPKDNDWFAQGSVLKQGQDLGKFGRDFNVSVLVYSNPEDSSLNSKSCCFGTEFPNSVNCMTFFGI
jgi:hypothetical protein